MLTSSVPMPYPHVVYAPDGKDHSLQCDPKYKLLLDHKATLGKCGYFTFQNLWGIVIDYTKIPNTPGLRDSIQKLIDDWNCHHMFQYLMNTLSEKEYAKYISSYTSARQYREEGNKRLAEYRKKKEQEDKKNEIPTRAKESESRDNGTTSKDEFDRMQVISEYGW